ncbi:hypothetical protein N825_15210 [Skermanella stibiiresistens SB22]|jgi:hypothetical protein|uniref:Tryptophan synthase subunit beta n=1 Tax=Skermanella stibiiresistens SB22 TaxID=1385369 RepID=W9GZG8_9PROT|nr:hypothetical protein [Skermanella stibiiresistens]EWY37996.1 hypothetical protein N825_15210 [Skermanella stibiiresistens SB22]
MTNHDERRLDRSLDRLQRNLPGWISRMVGGLRNPDQRWIRIPAGVLLIIGGILGFLPILGFWMVPLGLLLLALDIPFLRRPTAGVMIRGERRWTSWRRSRREQP